MGVNGEQVHVAASPLQRETGLVALWQPGFVGGGLCLHHSPGLWIWAVGGLLAYSVPGSLTPSTLILAFWHLPCSLQIRAITCVCTVIMVVCGSALVRVLGHLRRCDPMACSLPGSSVHWIFQARILKWVATSSSRGIFLAQGSNPCHLPRLLHQQVDSLRCITWEAQ